MGSSPGSGCWPTTSPADAGGCGRDGPAVDLASVPAAQYAAPVTDQADVETVERVIPAPPEKIFDLLSDAEPPSATSMGRAPSARPRASPTRSRLSSTFGMSMKMGLPYSMVSTVVEFEENRLIAWQTHGPTEIGQYVGGRIWRYELEPVDGGTLVRESWDISQESGLTKPVVRMGAASTRKNMAATLERIEKLVTA